MNENRKKRINDYIQQDAFANWLGAEVKILKPGSSRVKLEITEAMTNFHGCAHGGVIFALSDIAFGAASNSRGQTAVALNVGINFIKAAVVGDRLVAEAVEQTESGPTATYDIVIRNELTGEIIAKSQNLVYRKKEWFVEQ